MPVEHDEWLNDALAARYIENFKLFAPGCTDAVKAAGMSFPFPQREVRLLGDPESRA